MLEDLIIDEENSWGNGFYRLMLRITRQFVRKMETEKDIYT